VTDSSLVPSEQVTVTGQLPGVVRLPTFQVHDAIPLLLAYLGSRPAAVEGPDLYSTMIVHAARAMVFTFAVAYAPRLTGEVSEVNDKANVGAVVGSGTGSVVGARVGAGGGLGVMAENGASVAVGTKDWMGGTTAIALDSTAAGGVAAPEPRPPELPGEIAFAIAPDPISDATTTAIR